MKLFIDSNPARSRTPQNQRNVYLRHDPLELEQRILADAGRQIENIAFAMAKQLPSRKTAELIEIAAKIQSFRLEVQEA